MHEGKSYFIMGTFKNGKPIGQVSVTVDGGEVM